MKLFLPLLLAFIPLGLAACNPSSEEASAPNPQPAADAEAETAPIAEVSYEGVSFVNTLPGTNADGQTVEAAAPVPDTPPGDETPEHILFEFQPYYPEVFQNNPGIMLPQIAIYSMEQFAEYEFEGEAAALRTLLDSRPDPASQPELPYLPSLGADQVFHAAETYLEFNGGSGIRYITAYAQDVSPLTTERVFYTFQGLTNDGRYISATFPIQTGLLPDTADLEGADYDAFAANYENFLTQTRDRINAANPDDFQPSLNQLDELIESLTVQ
ncbi:MAG TPA: hypothetical protein V6D06_19505 [Trichocoleus sp.]